MLTDQGTSGRSIAVRLSDQRAFLYKRGEVVADLSRFNWKRGLQYPPWQAPRYRQGYRPSLQYLRRICPQRSGREGRCRCEERSEAARRSLRGSPNAVLSSNCSFIRTARRSRSRISRFPWVHPAPGSLGKTLLPRGESRNAGPDLSLGSFKSSGPRRETLSRKPALVSHRRTSSRARPPGITRAFLPPGVPRGPPVLGNSTAEICRHSLGCKEHDEGRKEKRSPVGHSAA